MAIKYSILDLATIIKGDDIHTTFQKSVKSAQNAEKLGFTRYWFSEHHNFPNVASAATAILIAHVAGKTETIRVGSGGIMLPNHSTLSVAEQFGTLDALFPGRIDLGLGRAPGTDMLTASALRGNNFTPNYNFEFHIKELQKYMSAKNADSKVRAIPGEGADVPLFILGSSTDSAFLAAKLGLPYAFAAHFAPSQLDVALEIYRSRFQPSEFLDEPYVLVCVNIIAGDSVEEAQYLSTSHFQAFVSILTDQRQPLLPPEETDLEHISDEVALHLNRMAAKTFVGDRETLTEKLTRFAKDYKPDEIIVSGNIYDFDAKQKSYEITADIIKSL
ncbi:LLM class flavin-dependent oxidoreductase [Chryseobacterium sp. SC28]|uniref:LLM class flavin-dependent oxidoreductase n=1 Tax=Chryseobacterium sp. SC28 TaxID=2268028 RepID=UPI000F64675A|nr:LLM class flavin-dependent oxidoreductase [Chryseobacterium sp. SC28]RRQ46817.1 LLM class flavin-dependent oxidoreductase [Chryseobacterium sp. SC28]